MPKVDLAKLIKKDREIELEVEKLDRKSMLPILRTYPKDTPPEYDKIDYEDLFDFI